MHPARPPPSHLALLAALACACAVPDGSVDLLLTPEPDFETLFEPLALDLRADPQTGEHVVLRGDVVLARGVATPGAELPFMLDGKRYVLTFGDHRSENHCEYPDPNLPERLRRNFPCREFEWQDANLRSPDGPLPGTAATRRGSDPRPFLLTSLPGVVVGLLVGRAALAHLGLGLLLALAAIAGAIALGGHLHDPPFTVTHAVATVAFAASGAFATIAWHDNSRAAGLAFALGPIAGAVPFVLAHPLWSASGPLLAVGAGALAVVVLVVLLFVVGEALGAEHPTSIWLFDHANKGKPPPGPGAR